MKKIILFCILCVVLSGCMRVVRPMPPTDLPTVYRQSLNVILIQCQKTYVEHRHRYDDVSIVEAVDTGERFQIYGCYGKSGDRFKITY